MQVACRHCAEVSCISRITCSPSKAVTLPNIGVPQYIGVPPPTYLPTRYQKCGRRAKAKANCQFFRVGNHQDGKAARQTVRVDANFRFHPQRSVSIQKVPVKSIPSPSGSILGPS